MKSLRLILSDSHYFAPAWVFASLNILTGTWVLYLPHIKTKFALNDAQVGVALFCLALGLLMSISMVPYINRKFGVGKSTRIGIVLFAISFNLPLLAPSYILLCMSLLLTGVFSGFTDISMNALVSTIESRNSKHFMSAAHGFFSLGGFIGAGVGSVFINIFSIPVWHMLIVSNLIIISNLYLSKNYIDITEIPVAKHSNESKFKNIWPLIGLAIVAFIIMFNEGAVEHWSNLFLYDVVQADESQSGFGFIAFSLFMTIGRFLGDGISQRIGSIRIICFGSIIAIAAHVLVITSSFVFTVSGFGLLGLGLSVVIPELFRLAGSTDKVPASTGISIVSGIGFTGFLIGPVLLGLISNWTDLMWSFAFLAVLLVGALGITLFRLNRNYR